MKVTPRSEEEVNAMDTLPAGKYDFEVRDAVEKYSQSGNEMIELVLTVFGEDGSHRTVYDWLVSSDANLCIRKVRHFSACVGLLGQYESGELNVDSLIGLSGRVELSVDRDPQYGSRNRVADYCVPGDYVSRSESQKPDASEVVNPNKPRANDGEVPF